MRAQDGLARHVVERTRALAASVRGPAASTVAVAVSGGGDSVALAVLLAEAGVARALLHVDHGLRADSADDAAFVHALGERLGLVVVSERVDVRAAARRSRRNLADAARRVRAATLGRLATRVGAGTIALGHTLDDQAETVLLQLLRGAATLGGMPARRGRLIRPVLDVRRAALREALLARGFGWRDDPSNDDPTSRRARMRHEVVPVLERVAPGASERLVRHARIQRDLAEFVAKEASRRVRGLPDAGGGRAMAGGTAAAGGVAGPVDARTVAALPPALQREVLVRLMHTAGAEVDLAHVEAVRARLRTDGPWRLSLGRAASVEVEHGRLRVVHGAAPGRGAGAAAATAATAGAGGAPSAEVAPVERPEDLPAGIHAEVLDGGRLELRTRRPGDTIRLPGGRRSVSDLLIDRKVPRAARDRLRMLARGREVLWIEGVAVAVGAGPEPGVVATDEERWMRRALELAREAAAAGEAPVGAVVVVEGRVVGEGRNRTEGDADPSAHAELLALRAAAGARGDWRLAGATLVVTLEPCPMCFGAVLQAHVDRVVYGARNLREGALGGVVDLSTEGWKRSVDVEGGVLERACAAVLRDFFERSRSSARRAPGSRSRP